jgi:hypothetical protein
MTRSGGGTVNSLRVLRGLLVLAAIVVFVPGAAAWIHAEYHGSITSGDPSHVDALRVNGEVSECVLAPKTFPGTEGSIAAFRYDTYTERNTTPDPQCARLTLSTDPCQDPLADAAFATAYRNSFNPSNLSENYIADLGARVVPCLSGDTLFFSVIVQPGDSLVTVVEEYTPGGTGVEGYTLVITGLATAADVATFSAKRSGGGVVLRWHTATELNVLGFNVYREEIGRRVRVNKQLIAASGTARGYKYLFVDHRPRAAKTPRYRLQIVHVNGARSWFGAAQTS